MSAQPSWRAATKSYDLAPGDVHVWRADLRRCPGEEQAAAVLSAEEQSRAARFLDYPARRLYTASHVVVREILARYLRVRAADVQLSINSRGKPMISGSDNPIRFNLSHSGDIALCAVAAGHELGIDVERVRPESWNHAVAEQLFTRTELRSLCALPLREQSAAFFCCWTRKEAFAKATGMALRADLTQTELGVSPQGAEVMGISMVTFGPVPGYLASLAVVGRFRSVQFCDYAVVERAAV
jgi:4'-phosphopantetheinyl transferase